MMVFRLWLPAPLDRYMPALFTGYNNIGRKEEVTQEGGEDPSVREFNAWMEEEETEVLDLSSGNSGVG